ncbi:MAG: hypothetical protein KDA96_26215, partial [Planctomycetaceae bacterium]|nr:hypothetical protein [Planctomycetaceae bacterium]
MQAEQDTVERFYNKLPSRAGAAFLVLVPGCFGLMLLAGSFRNGPGGMRSDEILLLVLGLAIVTLTVLLARHMFAARTMLTSTHMIVRGWIGSRRWKYSEITGLAVFNRRIK